MTADERHLAREIGLTLRRLRLEQGATQKELAQRVAGGMDATYIGKIERGEQLPSLKVLLRLSKALHVSVGEFFYPPPEHVPEHTSAALHLEPLLRALTNRGIDGIALIYAILDAVGRHVLVPPRRAAELPTEAPPRPGRHTVIPLPSRFEE
jgi:transcriptional regulator with XRE-family HTH domain